MATGYSELPSLELIAYGQIFHGGDHAPNSNHHCPLNHGPSTPVPMQVSRGVIENWKTWKQMWSNYSIVTLLYKQTPEYTVQHCSHMQLGHRDLMYMTVSTSLRKTDPKTWAKLCRNLTMPLKKSV